MLCLLQYLHLSFGAPFTLTNFGLLSRLQILHHFEKQSCLSKNRAPAMLSDGPLNALTLSGSEVGLNLKSGCSNTFNILDQTGDSLIHVCKLI